MAADVVAVVRLRHREHKRDPRRAGLDRILATPLTRREDLRDQAGDAGAGGQQFGRVAQLRHGRGAHKGADLDPAQPGGHQPLQHLDLGFGRNERADALKPVARADFHDLDGGMFGRMGHRGTVNLIGSGRDKARGETGHTKAYARTATPVTSAQVWKAWVRAARYWWAER